MGREKPTCCSSQLWESPLGESRVLEELLRWFCVGDPSPQSFLVFLRVRAQPTKSPFVLSPRGGSGWAHSWAVLKAFFLPWHVQKCKECSAKCSNKASFLSWSAHQGLGTIKHFSVWPTFSPPPKQAPSPSLSTPWYKSCRLNLKNVLVRLRKKTLLYPGLILRTLMIAEIPDWGGKLGLAHATQNVR